MDGTHGEDDMPAAHLHPGGDGGKYQTWEGLATINQMQEDMGKHIGVHRMEPRLLCPYTDCTLWQGSERGERYKTPVSMGQRVEFHVTHLEWHLEGAHNVWELKLRLARLGYKWESSLGTGESSSGQGEFPQHWGEFPQHRGEFPQHRGVSWCQRACHDKVPSGGGCHNKVPHGGCHDQMPSGGDFHDQVPRCNGGAYHVQVLKCSCGQGGEFPWHWGEFQWPVEEFPWHWGEFHWSGGSFLGMGESSRGQGRSYLSTGQSSSGQGEASPAL